jgi:UDP-2,4-diacetamido-2,4,6-trideoxy-beta-L-altropyranose hydrolase
LRVTTFVVRCDASATLGLGHFVRCLSLAQELRRRGATVVFACRTLLPLARRALAGEGITCRALPVVSQPDGGLLDEVPLLVDLAWQSGASAAIIDHYSADGAYLARLRDAGLHLVVVDDLAGHDLRAAEVVINQNLGAEGLPYRTAPTAARLFGPAFAMVRGPFRERREKLVRTWAAGDNRLVVTLGGGELSDILVAVLAALDTGNVRELAIRCIVGGAAAAELKGRACASRHRVELIGDASDMAEHLAWADVSLNAGGSTCWEMCCLGVPMMLLALSSDQEPTVRELGERGCALALGPDVGAAPAVVEQLLADPGRRAAMSRSGMALVDGRGGARVAEAVLAVTQADYQSVA